MLELAQHARMHEHVITCVYGKTRQLTSRASRSYEFPDRVTTGSTMISPVRGHIAHTGGSKRVTSIGLGLRVYLCDDICLIRLTLTESVSDNELIYSIKRLLNRGGPRTRQIPSTWPLPMLRHVFPLLFCISLGRRRVFVLDVLPSPVHLHDGPAKKVQHDNTYHV